MVKDICIDDFDYNLPEEKIPLHPLEKRDECKLLLRTSFGKIFHRKFKELPDLLPPGVLMVCNDTKVINARLPFQKDTGASIEIFLLEPVAPADYALSFQAQQKCTWKCLVGNSKKWKEGDLGLKINDDVILYARRNKALQEGESEIEFHWDNSSYTFANLIEQAGKIPIPPYLNRDTEESDLSDYQTVYARVKGSVAAPTAGLHFTPEVFEGLAAHGVDVEKVTLHVGAGTFRPVKSDTIGGHPMHAEPFTVTQALIKKLITAKEKGMSVTAVGTTTVRTLESLPYIGHALKKGYERPFEVAQWSPYGEEEIDTLESLKAISDYLSKKGAASITASTSIMIAPGFQWRVADIIVTNFHQPKSTLLLLVSSFIGNAAWKIMYEEALSHDYRFLSYGDACLLMRQNN